MIKGDKFSIVVDMKTGDQVSIATLDILKKTHIIEYSGEECSGIVDGEAFKKCINRTIPSPEMQFTISKPSKRLIINRHTDIFWINCLLLYRDEK